MFQTTLDAYTEATESSKLNQAGRGEGHRSSLGGLVSFCCSLHGCCLTNPGSSNPPPRDAAPRESIGNKSSKKQSSFGPCHSFGVHLNCPGF